MSYHSYHIMQLLGSAQTVRMPSTASSRFRLTSHAWILHRNKHLMPAGKELVGQSLRYRVNHEGPKPSKPSKDGWLGLSSRKTFLFSHPIIIQDRVMEQIWGDWGLGSGQLMTTRGTGGTGDWGQWGKYNIQYQDPFLVTIWGQGSWGLLEIENLALLAMHWWCNKADMSYQNC